jgi:hypothetical protein
MLVRAVTFAVAHELAHILLGLPQPPRVLLTADPSEDDGRFQEHQADLIALTIVALNERNRWRRLYAYVGIELALTSAALHDEMCFVLTPQSHPVARERLTYVRAYAEQVIADLPEHEPLLGGLREMMQAAESRSRLRHAC